MSYKEDLNRAFLNGLLYARHIIRKNAPIISGDLRDASDFSQIVQHGPFLLSYLGIDNSALPGKTKYGDYVVFGTGLYGPHKQLIKPKNYPNKKKALAWGPIQANGHPEFARRSTKGMKPNNYFQKGYDESSEQVAHIVGANMRVDILKHLKEG